MSDLAPAIDRVALDRQVEIPNLRTAAAKTLSHLTDFRSAMEGQYPVATSPEVAVLFFGSVARGEATSGSDSDYLLLVDKVPDDPAAIMAMSNVVKSELRELGLTEPGAQGIFGEVAVVGDMVSRIGLEGDSNTSTTRRLLVLCESVAGYRADLRSSLIDVMLRRYTSDYRPAHRTKATRPHVPRFLLNDVVRYWRTITVDFGAKRWRTQSPEWFLRYAKMLRQERFCSRAR